MLEFQRRPPHYDLCVSRLILLVGGLLLSPLTADDALGHSQDTDSGVATSQYELTQPELGSPPRPEPSSDVPGAGDAGASDDRAFGHSQELSIEPSSPPLLPADAPAWIGSPPKTSGEIHYLHVGGQIAESESEAARLLDEELVTALCSYIDSTVLNSPAVWPQELENHMERHSIDIGDRMRGRAAEALKKKITPDFIWKNLIDDQQGYVARLNTSGIPMFQKWVTVSITPAQRAMIIRWDREATQRARLAPVGVGMLSLLGSVGLLHLIFRGRKPRQ